MDRKEYGILWNKIIRFVDDFRRNPSEDKLKEPVEFTNDVASAFYAGVVVELANEQNMAVPQWVFQKKYYLSEPAFLTELRGEYKIFVALETPLAFKVRNIFVGADTLFRC